MDLKYPAVTPAVEQVARNNRLEPAGLDEVSPDKLVQIVRRRKIKEQ